MMLLFHEPASWPTWKVALVMGLGDWLGGGVVGSGGWQFDKSVQAFFAIFPLMSLFIFTDALWLHSLPRRGISFGPWQAQLFVFALPRLAVALGLGLFVGLVGLGGVLGDNGRYPTNRHLSSLLRHSHRTVQTLSDHSGGLNRPPSARMLHRFACCKFQICMWST